MGRRLQRLGSGEVRRDARRDGVRACPASADPAGPECGDTGSGRDEPACGEWDGTGRLTNIPQFSYNANNDPNLQSAATWANNLIASQNAAAGGYGSGNMASALNQEDVGTLEPQYYNQAFQNYDVNQIQPRQMIYNMLTGNTSGAGGAMAQNVANLDTGRRRTRGSTCQA